MVSLIISNIFQFCFSSSFLASQSGHLQKTISCVMEGREITTNVGKIILSFVIVYYYECTVGKWHNTIQLKLSVNQNTVYID